MPMKVTLHDYVTDPALTQKDGVNLAHENIAALMRAHAGESFEVRFHDFNRLLKDEAYARAILDDIDCVISNVGPHAHYYFYLRHRYGLDFKIFRDVRTAIWSSYLLQEYLCAPFLQSQDVLMVSSHYTWGIYGRIFPHLKRHAIFRCYPMTVAFPAELPQRRNRQPGDAFVLGYVGRLSEDKNFPDLVTLLIKLVRAGGHFKLLACGDIHSPSCHPQFIQSQLYQALGAGDFFELLPSRSNGEIWPIYSQFDAMIFPSTSNLETLGRVLIEASYVGLPVVCGAHAAAPELMPPSSLCSVEYSTGQPFSSHYDHCLGKVDIQQMALAITDGKLTRPRCHLDYLRHPALFLQTLAMDADQIKRQNELRLEPVQAAFIQSLEMEMPEALSLNEADATVSRLIPWFLTLQQQGSPERQALLCQLKDISTHRERTRRFIQKSVNSLSDFTNIGGIDIELCHLANFYPRFQLSPAAVSSAKHDEALYSEFLKLHA